MIYLDKYFFIGHAHEGSKITNFDFQENQLYLTENNFLFKVMNYLPATIFDNFYV